MFSDKVRAQDFAVRILKAHLEGERLAQSYILTGQKQAGKEEMAMAFAAALNCTAGHFFQACECVDCHKLESGNHPDLHILGEDPKVKSIKMEEIRRLISQVSLKPYEAKRKVFVLLEAGRLTADASNALLKTLEEPPPHTVFILTAENRSQLLETIQSRSFEIRLKATGGVDEDAGTKAAALRILAGRNWEDILEEYSAVSKDELRRKLDMLMEHFRQEIAETSGPDAASRVRAIELILETKDALDANANQKLALSRLAMRFRRVLSPAFENRLQGAAR